MGANGGVATKRMRLVSDDGVEFCAVDLPGIADAEDEVREFSDMTLDWARQCDVVVWVTDARTALLTTHETDEFHDSQIFVSESPLTSTSNQSRFGGNRARFV